MNRRLVLISQEETPDYSKFWGSGLGSEIYTIEQIDSMDEGTRDLLLTLGDSDGVMLVGGKPFKYLRDRYHFGVRAENYSDCAKLYRLSIEGGSFAKCILDFPDPDVINEFMNPMFTVPRDYSWYKQKVIKTYAEAVSFFTWLSGLSPDVYFGFDYEASGMPTDKWFEVSGASICTLKYGGFLSFTDLRHSSSAQEYQDILGRLASFLVSRQDHIWVYNMQYEFQVSHRLLGVDLYNLCDASVFNILDGFHYKKLSLKWTSQRVLFASVWDSEFDRISELIDSMLFTEVGKLKKDKKKVLKVTPGDFKNTPEWAELCKRYSAYIQEFESLILEYWGNPFMCIPSDILGFYCNLDAFYTLMLYETKRLEYSPRAISVFCDNLRLACRLHSCGIPKDEAFRTQYESYCKEQMAWGITYCATARCKIKMAKHEKKMAKIEKYKPIAVLLLRQGKFFGGNTVDIAKEILQTHIDTMDSYELGVDEGKLLLDYGPDFATSFLSALRDCMFDSGMIKEMKKTGERVIKQKIEAGVERKRKLLELLGNALIPILGLDKIKIGEKHIELEKYIYYERAYTELLKISRTQLKDINHIPAEIYAFGKKMTNQEYSDYVSENYFKCKSPIENDEICLEFAQLYPAESSFLAALFDSSQQLNHAEKFYSTLGIDTVEKGFEHFMGWWDKACKEGLSADQTPYPEKMYTLAYQYYKDLGCDQVKEIWSNFNGYNAQSMFFKYVDSEYLEYGKPFDESDLGNNFFFMRKLVLSYLMYKKYAKILTTYIGTYDPDKEEFVGMFKGSDKCVIEDPKNHIIIREADPDEPGAVNKISLKFQCMEKSSKRWSSGMHF